MGRPERGRSSLPPVTALLPLFFLLLGAFPVVVLVLAPLFLGTAAAGGLTSEGRAAGVVLRVDFLVELIAGAFLGGMIEY